MYSRLPGEGKGFNSGEQNPRKADREIHRRRINNGNQYLFPQVMPVAYFVNH